MPRDQNWLLREVAFRGKKHTILRKVAGWEGQIGRELLRVLNDVGCLEWCGVP